MHIDWRAIGERSMMTIETDSPVLVTGATGFVAGWIVKELL